MLLLLRAAARGTSADNDKQQQARLAIGRPSALPAARVKHALMLLLLRAAADETSTNDDKQQQSTSKHAMTT